MGPSGSIHYGSHEWELMSCLHRYLPKDNSKEHSPSHEPQSEQWPKICPKNTYDAFLNSPLSTVLSDNGVERVVVTGAMTDCCCDTTARSAFNRGFETWLISDACASASKKQHDAGLNGFGFAFGSVATTKEALGMLQEGGG